MCVNIQVRIEACQHRLECRICKDLEGAGMTSTTIPRNTSVWLDVMRAMAAQAVILGHLFQLFFFGNHAGPESAPTMFVHRIIIAISLYSHEAVMVFFVLSGYLVGGSVIKHMQNRSFSWRQYATARLSRLWTVLIPCLILTAILDGMSIQFGRGEFFLTHWHSMYLEGWFEGRNAWSIGSFLGNVFFVTRFITLMYGSNVSLWSLTNEFWYYMLLPSCFMLFAPQIRRRIIAVGVFVCMGALLLTIHFSSAVQFVLGFFIWMMGAVVAIIPRNRIIEASKFAILLAAVAFLWSGHFAGFSNVDDLLVGLVTASMIGLSTYVPFSFVARIGKFMAGYSYSLYAMHLPILVLFFSLDPHTAISSPYGAPDLFRFMAYFILVNFFCIIFWYAFERNTEAVKAWTLNVGGRFVHTAVRKILDRLRQCKVHPKN